jgi:hypothetical protein
MEAVNVDLLLCFFHLLGNQMGLYLEVLLLIQTSIKF